jgi:hypothetical protein
MEEMKLIFDAASGFCPIEEMEFLQIWHIGIMLVILKIGSWMKGEAKC